MFRLALVMVLGCTADRSEPDSPCTGKCDGPTSVLAANDVSILFPLPANQTERAHFLWLVPRAGEQGPYFKLSDTLPDLNADLPSSFGYPSAMITSLRFDPCFPKLGGARCQAQLRLVAQPVFPGPSSTMMLDDAAAHLFYALDAAEADAVVAKLRAIRAASPVSTDGPLRVHPALVADLAATSAAVRALVVAHCREDNLVRITTNSFAFDIWTFARFDRTNGELARVELVGMQERETSQAWVRQAQRDTLDDPSGTISPASADGFDYLLSAASFAGGAPVDAARARAAARRLLAIENPDLTDPESVDCTSCHVATQARLFAARNGVAFDADTRFVPPPGTDARLVLDPELGGNVGATIAFGYHANSLTGRTGVPSISQRTVNESVAIAAHLSP